jgi:hypothetical protein
MRGTIFYQGNRIEAVDNAKYYMQHKKKIRAIMSRQSPNCKYNLSIYNHCSDNLSRETGECRFLFAEQDHR